MALVAVQAAPVDDAQDRQAGKNKIGGKTGNIVYAGGNPIFNEFAPAVRLLKQSKSSLLHPASDAVIKTWVRNQT